jgi:hypothetical protein
MPNKKLINAASYGPACTTDDGAYPIQNAGFYKFESNYNDSSGNGKNGTQENGCCTPNPFSYNVGGGKFGTGLNSVSTSFGYSINLPSDTVNWSTGTFSISLWQKQQPGYSSTWVSQYNYNPSYGNNTLTSFQFGTNSSGKPTFYTRYSNGTAGWTNVNATMTRSTSTWTHICMTRLRGGFIKVYQNGSLLGSLAVSNTTLQSSSQSTQLFTFYNRQNAQGTFDHVRLFNSELTAAQALLLYQEIEC